MASVKQMKLLMKRDSEDIKNKKSFQMDQACNQAMRMLCLCCDLSQALWLRHELSRTVWPTVCGE